MDSFTVLLDAPTEPVKRIQIAKLGSFNDPRYGEFDITRENVENWQRNLSKLPGGEALIDFEHRSERTPRDSKAAGWISGIDIDGDRVMADARWTPDGEAAIRGEVYRFTSPTFGPTLGADNQLLDDALPSVALTNKPVLGMPALMLASAERVSEAIDEDPALRFHVRALDGELGEVTQALVMLDVSQAERDQAKSEGNSLPDKSYPIRNVKQLKAAAILAASKHGNWKAALTLIRRRAKDLGVDVTTLQGFAPKTADSPAAMDTEVLKTLDLDDGTDAAAVVAAIEALKARTLPAAVLKALDLADTADETQILAAIKKLSKAPKTEPTKTLEQLAADDGKIVLDAETWDKTRRRAKEGADALERVKTLEQQAAENRFESTFKLALEDPKGPRVTPAEKDDLKELFALDADKVIHLIESREPVVNGKPLGLPAMQLDQDADPQQVAAAGFHPDSHAEHLKIQKYMLDNKIPVSRYAHVVDQVQEGSLVL